MVLVVGSRVSRFDICSQNQDQSRSLFDSPVDGGTILFTEVMTTWKSVVNLLLYSGPMFNPAISDRHFKVTFLNSATSRN